MRNEHDPLVAEAQGVLGAEESVLAAGIFGLAELTAAQVVGGTAGAVAADEAGVPLGGAVGALLGGMAAKQAAAAERGATLQLLVAITAERIHVLNRDDSGRVEREFASFERAHSTVDVRNVGLSRILTLADPATGVSIELHGSVSWLSAQAHGDKTVLALLDTH